ncbi:MAG: D-lactate dehydrogenase [Elusimicrobia bacterium ADurb.Bin231]|nr:MAG: D-lactate dehydrogenase [Elusimicrobia bacterium ADurb.Bin231]
MERIKLAFFDAKPYDIEFFNIENAKYGYHIKYFLNRLNSDTVAMSQGFNAVCIFVNDNVTKDVVKILLKNKIKIIALRCAGYNNVDLSSVYNKIHVVRVPDYSPYAVAEHTVGIMLSLNRKIHKAYYRTRDNNFNINGLLGFDMNGKTAGIIGTGKIGKVLIKILKGFNVKILAYDPYPDKDFAEKMEISYVPLDKLYRSSDIISLHCPLTKDTFHLIDHSAISKMKTGVMVINTGRGRLIDTKALIEALKHGKIGSAGLDVYEEESEYFFEDFSDKILPDDALARLLSFNNVLITSHQAFFTKEALTNIARTTLGNIFAYSKGEKLANEVCYKCDKRSCCSGKSGKCF